MTPSHTSLEFDRARPTPQGMEEQRGVDRTESGSFAAQPGFDWGMMLLGAAFVGGLFLDGWAHRHGRVDNSFFTPWHAVLYGGWGACLLTLGATFGAGLAKGRGWRSALPAGYGLSLVGAMLWLIGGPADLLWHELFGFEADVEALLSPSHFILALGMALVVTGPLRSVWRRADVADWGECMLAPLSLTLLLSVITFFTLMGHPMATMPGSAVRGAAFRSLPPTVIMTLQANAVIGLLYWTMLLMGMVLLILGRARAPLGALTVMIGANAIAMGFMYPGERGPYPLAPVLAFVLVGVIADALYLTLQPHAERPRAWRRFAFALPVVMMLAYFISVRLTYGLTWTIHLWLGTVIFCGVLGWLMSYLVVPWRPAAAMTSPREL